MSGGGAARFRRWYGDSPWQLALLAASFALTGYAGVRLLDGDTVGVLVWFVGAALLHDLVLLPLYSLADRLPRLAGPWTNHLRVPAALSLLLLLVWFPLIAGPPARYERVTGLPGGGGFARRWLLVSAALFALSGLLFLVRRARGPWRAAWRARKARAALRAAHAQDQEERRRSATNERPPDDH